MRLEMYIVCQVIAYSLWITSADAEVRYVKPTASGTGDCGSWANACTLPVGLSLAQSGDELWCKSGTYAGITLKDAVKIIGGFAGTETSSSQSNPSTNVTIVDGGGIGRCVYSADHTAATMFRGFKIISGFDGDDHGGGGLYMSDSSAMIVQCTFEDNTASYLGGAVVVYAVGGPNYSPQFVNCVFRNNGSTATDDWPYEGGAVFIQGGIVTFTNCLFHGNNAGGGGAIAKVPGSYGILTNCTFANNQATLVRGGAIRDESGDILLRNCILWGNTRLEGIPPTPILDQIHSPGYDAQVQYSDVDGGWPGTGNINADPHFQNSATDNYELQSTSPCKNTGDSDALPADLGDLDWDGNPAEPIPIDLARYTRVGLGTVDMGAYEFGCHTASPDCNLNGVPDWCEIEADPTLDCTNQNGILDLCETNPSIPRGACCIGSTCNWPTTSCQCTAGGGEWHQGKKCFQVTCGIPTE